MELRAEVEGSREARIWFPIPQSSPYQAIDALRIEGPFRRAHDDRGNLIGCVERRTRAMSFEVLRLEHRQDVLTRGPMRLGYASLPGDGLAPERLVPLDDRIRGWAREVVGGARSDLDKARAIYNHVVATVKYDKSGTGWGRGDIYYACDARRGNCTDFHAVLIGYCRAVGVPARFAIGLPVPRDRREGRIEGYHCWAEFFARGYGWVPVDASEAAKNPERREYFFGAHDEHRVELTRGRDIRLRPAPASGGAPLNFFVFPYAEAGGRRVEVTPTVTFADV